MAVKLHMIITYEIDWRKNLVARTPSAPRRRPCYDRFVKPTGDLLLYTKAVLDRSTGDTRIAEIGDWITVTELGERYGVGNRTVRAILHHMGVLQKEGNRYRLPLAFVAKGYGKRNLNPKTGFPFDVVSPLCQAMVADTWDETFADYETERTREGEVAEIAGHLADFESPRQVPLDAAGKIRWVLDHHGGIPLATVAAIVEVDPGYVTRIAKERARQRKAATERKLSATHSQRRDGLAA